MLDIFHIDVLSMYLLKNCGMSTTNRIGVSKYLSFVMFRFNIYARSIQGVFIIYSKCTTQGKPIEVKVSFYTPLQLAFGTAQCTLHSRGNPGNTGELTFRCSSHPHFVP